jgi:hypothetical protein
VKPLAKRLCVYGVPLLILGAWVASEVLYNIRIRPAGIRTAADHFRRFGEPEVIYQVQRGGSTFYEFTGFSRSAPPLLAVPSSPPAYIYDQNGKFVSWCSDPGDQPAYRQTWPRVSETPLDKDAVRQRFSKGAAVDLH